MRYSPEVRRHALSLLEQGVRLSVVERGLGISKTTLLRWRDPHMDEISRQASRRAKEKRRRHCVDCGTSVWYTSTRCPACAAKEQSAHRRWTREAIIAAIQEWAREHGKQPSAHDWRRSGPTHPSATAVYNGPNKPFRSWSEALQAAGFSARRGVGPGNSSWTVAEAHKLRAQGWSDRAIAQCFGVSPSAIGQRAGRRPKAPVKHRSREQRIADLRKAIEKGEQDGNWN